MSKYIPDKGDFVILTFDPQAGHEQMGRRPALLISNKLFNEYTGLALVSDNQHGSEYSFSYLYSARCRYYRLSHG